MQVPLLGQGENTVITRDGQIAQRDCKGRIIRCISVIPLSVRFWDKVQKTETCWLWYGATDPDGYASFKNPSKGYMDKAARISWELANGTIPEGLFVLHTCDNRLCVRPDHLFLGTQLDNIKDMVSKGRQRGAPGARNRNWKGGISLTWNAQIQSLS